MNTNKREQMAADLAAGNNRFQQADRDAVLVAFAEAGQSASLAEWMRRYPELAGELARFAAQRWRRSAANAGYAAETVAESGAVFSAARAEAVGLEVFRAARSASLPDCFAAATAPIRGLKEAAAERGLDPAAVAETLQLPVTFFWKLHRRLFTPESVPSTLVQALAETLGRAADDIRTYLRQPPALATGASYRADTAPEARQEDFRSALCGSPDVSAAARERWQQAD